MDKRVQQKAGALCNPRDFALDATPATRPTGQGPNAFRDAGTASERERRSFRQSNVFLLFVFVCFYTDPLISHALHYRCANV